MTVGQAVRALVIGSALLLATSVAASQRWFVAGRPTAQALEAVGWLTDAASHGLRPADYGAAALARATERGGDAATIAAVDRQLSQAVRRFLTHLRRGRVDPRRIHHDFSVTRDSAFDAASALDAAVASGRLGDALQAATPGLPLYASLRDALQRYRTLVGHPAWRQPLPMPAPVLAPGGDYEALAQLAQRLRALGDLAGDAGVPVRYEGALVEAVRSFQGRHALVVDGVVGRATLAQLAVAPAARVRQIELTMERLRWTPLMQGRRMIVINIPEFVLRAYEVRDGRIRVERQMKVVVGKALDMRTPLFDEDMRFIEFSPYWNVPSSIARAETVPQLRRDPGAFDRLGFEFVAADGRVLRTLASNHLADVLAGRLRLRQRPGPQNALGDIKFVFPNDNAIFLHHTPATQLFERQRRDFSHGCIRVQQPVELATFVLQTMPEWTEARIRQAMQRGESSTLRLAEPVPVLIAYGTALVRSGRMFFFEDVYGLDRLLYRALQTSSSIR